MDTYGSGAGRPTARDPERLRLLGDQLARMRGMLFGYSERFFERIRTWTVVALALLVVAGAGVFPAAVVAVPFLVPFAFLETGYLFFHTVFARRHAEYLEGAINAALGDEVLVAHRLEAAYYYEPDRPKIAGISLDRPLGMFSAVTVGYTVGAALLWGAGILGTADLARAGRLSVAGLDGAVVVGAAVLWTVAVAAYLCWTFLARPDERRLLEELDAAYGGRSRPG